VPGNEATAEALRASGFAPLLAPLLRFEAVSLPDAIGDGAGALIVTSAAAFRAIELHPSRAALSALPLFAVGEATADAAQAAGFINVKAAGGDAVSLRELILGEVRARRLKKSTAFLYLAGADLSVDLEVELGARGLRVQTLTVYRMAMLPTLTDEAHNAFAAGEIEAVLHYSRRSAAAFVEAVRSAGVEISALALPHCCLSENIATAMREAGAHHIIVAQTPDEPALLQVLTRTLRPG
jgi:uroporphyrinogen-III synthase